MDIKDKIVGLALAALLSLVGWNLHETWAIGKQIVQLQQGQIVLEKQIKKNTNFVKQKLKQIKKRNKKENIDKAIKKNNKKKKNKKNKNKKNKKKNKQE